MEHLDIYDKLIDLQKSKLLSELKKKYKLYGIDDHIDLLVDELLESDIDFSKINKKYKKDINKMIIEKARIKPEKCLARRLNDGYGGQCTRYKIDDTEYCKNHQLEGNRWCGLITENRQEICYLINDKGKHPHKWRN